MRYTFNDGSETVILPDEDLVMDLHVTPVGPHTYRIDNVPFMSEEVSFGDIVEAEETQYGELFITGIVEKSKWVTTEYSVGGQDMSLLVDRAQELGCHWELVYNSILFVCIPPGVTFSPVTSLFGRLGK